MNDRVDIIERLRHEIYGTGDPGITILSDAIAEIERLKAALLEIADMDNRLDDCLSDATHVARKALEGKDG